MSDLPESLFNQFSSKLLHWFDKHGRKNLPWQIPPTPYRVWISEIMLQQTQVQTVIPYFNRFMERFPDNTTLAKATLDEVLAYWSGLGYYSRARNIYNTAQILCHDFKNQFPDAIEALKALPGIGPSTAAAICSLAFNQPTAILDGNVKRVLCRYFLIDGLAEKSSVKNKLMTLANGCMSKHRCSDYTQAIMDFGALCCTNRNPKCQSCPLSSHCLANQHQLVSIYPQKKQKKILPTKAQQFFVIFNRQHNIYLEKRPETGLWGGLWTLLTIDAKESLQNFLMTTYQIDCQNISPLLAFKHSFTHFHLDIEAYAVFIGTSDKIDKLPGQWFKEEEIINIGLPTPVHRIISHFFQLREQVLSCSG